MQIVRVIDTDGRITFGQRLGGADAKIHRIEGDILGEYRVTDEEVRVARLLAPIVPPNILCIGLNYRQHAIETGAPIPTDPVLFAKATTSLNDPGGPIVLPAVSKAVDYECELAVVIGRTAKNIPVTRVMDFVLGFTCANDVSERYWQKQLGQWVRAKSFDTFCPLGPWIETEIPNPNKLRLCTRVNGQTLQDSSTADMIFSVPELVSYLSRDLTLLPGTVILTGTPPGVGVARQPQVFLKPGDEVTVEIEGIGALTNPVVAAG